MASTWFLDIPLKRLIVVLASQSPRRNAILKQLGIEPIVEVSGYDEKMDEIKVSAEEFVKDCSMNKARMVAERLKKQNVSIFLIKYSRGFQQEFDLIVGCDTVIEMNGEIFGKPKDEEDAMRMLRM
jgi:septum formation protein